MQRGQAETCIEKPSLISAFFKKIDIAFFCLLLISAVFPLIGFGTYFRNEDAKLLIWLENNLNLLNAFDINIKYNVLTFRPAYETILRIVYIIFGNNPLTFQATSGLFFIGAIAFFYKLTQLLFNKNSAFLAVLSLFLSFFYIFHFLYTPLQGLQNAVELFLVTGNIFFALKSIQEGKFNHFYLLSVFFMILSIFTHPVSAFLIPLINISLILLFWKDLEKENTLTKSLALIFFSLFFSLIPVVTTQFTVQLEATKNDPLSVNSFTEYILSNPFAYISFMIKNYISYHSIFLNKINLLIISFPLFYGSAGFASSKFTSLSYKKNGTFFLYSMIAAVAGCITVYMIPISISFLLLSILILSVGFQDKKRLFLTIWFFGGILPLITKIPSSGVYIRHSAFALSLITGINYWKLFSDISVLMQNKLKKTTELLTLSRIAVSLTVMIALILISARFNLITVPFINKQIIQLDHFKNLGNNFKDVVSFLSRHAGQNEHIYFYHDKISKELYVKQIYTQQHLDWLRPSQFRWYTFYFQLNNRDDLIIEPIEKILEEPDRIKKNHSILVATNNWEADYLESHFSLEVLKIFRRGKTVAKIYKLIPPVHSSMKTG